MSAARTSSLVYALALLGSVVSGFLVALQTRVNGQLGQELDHGILAALFSFLTGLVALVVIVSLTPTFRQGVGRVRDAIRAGVLPWWMTLGGVAGAFVVMSQGISAGVLGIAVFSVAMVSGQTIGAIVIDHKGLWGTTVVKLSAWRAIGAVIVIGGVVIALDLDSAELARGALFLALPLVAGVIAGFQQAVNGRVNGVAQSAMSATLINFAVGTGALFIAFVISLPFIALPESLPTQWWLWVGGISGIGLIYLQAKTVSIIGVLALGVTLVTGQLAGSLLFDVFAPVGDVGVSAATIIGTLITLAGAIVVALARAPR